MKHLLPAVLILFASFYAHSQNFSVSGSVRSQQDEPVPFAAVSVNHSADSTLIKADVADDRGSFRISGIEPGKYFI